MAPIVPGPGTGFLSEILLQGGLRTPRGEGVLRQLRQRAKEVALMDELGLAPAQAAPTTKDTPENSDVEDDEEVPTTED